MTINKIDINEDDGEEDCDNHEEVQSPPSLESCICDDGNGGDDDDDDDDEEVEVEVPLVVELYGGSLPISLSHKVSLTLIIVRMMIMLKIWKRMLVMMKESFAKTTKANIISSQKIPLVGFKGYPMYLQMRR